MRVAIAAAVVCLTAFVLAIVAFSDSWSAEGGIQEATAHWESRIRAVGATAAYDEFADSVKDLAVPDQHPLAHPFGAALFNTEGVSGLYVCDGRFGFGCAHEFIGQAIAAHGLNVVEDLAQRCEDIGPFPASSGCDHSIGHGVLAFLGYDVEALRGAIAFCDSLDGEHGSNCSGGVFMEFNMLTMAENGLHARPHEGNPYDPCDSIGPRFSGTCFFWLPQWWQSVIFDGSDDENTFKRIAELCRGGNEELAPNKGRCFGGIGFIAMHSSSGDISGIISRCAAAAESSSESMSCLSTAAEAERLLYPKRPAEDLCDVLAEEASRYACKEGLR